MRNREKERDRERMLAFEVKVVEINLHMKNGTIYEILTIFWRDMSI